MYLSRPIRRPHRRLAACAAVIVPLTLAGGAALAAQTRVGHGAAPPAGTAGGVLRVGAPLATAARLGAAALGSAQTAARPLPASSAVTLLTGERVELDVTPDGQQTVAPAPAASSHAGGAAGERAAAEFTSFTWRGDEYVVPDEAIPYLGSVLDPRLFDVSYLVRSGLGGAHSRGLPVTISYSGRRPPSLPGVDISHAGHGIASATINAAQAPRFGGLLASLRQPSHPGHQAARAGLLPGIIRIGLAAPRGAPAVPADPLRSQGAAPARPPAGGRGLAFHTLTLHFTNLDGKPGLALGIVQNVGNLGLGLFLADSSGGSYTASVPDGTYSIGFNILTPHSATSAYPYRAALVVKPQVTVDSNETLTLDARTAKPYRATPATYPAGDSQRYDTLSFTRSSQTGGSFGSQSAGLNLLLFSLSRNYLIAGLRASPTAPVSKGGFSFDAASALYDPSPSPGDSPPRYYLVFPHRGSIPPSLSHTVPGASLTTVHEQIYASPTGVTQRYEELWPDVYLPWGDTEELATDWADHGTYLWPGRHTDYWYSSAPRLTVWQGSFNTDDSSRLWGQRWVIAPGQQISEAWNEAPQAPPPAAHPAQSYAEFGGVGVGPVTAARQTVCPACRQGDVGMLYLTADGDSDPGHYANAQSDAPQDRLRFYRGGKLTIDSAALPLAGTVTLLDPFEMQLPMLHRTAGYRLDWTALVHNDVTAATTTDWTFRSGPADPAAKLPRLEECAPAPGQRCSFLPLLFLTYHLPLNPQSQATAGRPFPVSFTVEHQQNQPPPAGVTATVSASFDNGKTWTSPQRAASQGGDRFSATIQQPALPHTSGFVALRVTARDGAGSAVTQTIIKAYGLTS
jgi:hypothetical protein